MATKVHDKQLLELHTEWVGSSHFRLTAHHITSSDKLVIDVMEISHHRMADKHTRLKLARNLARKLGAATMDAVQLSDFRADKVVTTTDGRKGAVKIRHTFYVFRGVDA